MYGRHLVYMVGIQLVWKASSLYGRHLVMTRMSLVMNNTCYIFILPFTALAFLSVRPTYAHIRVLVLHCAKIHIDHTVFSTAVPT